MNEIAFLKDCFSFSVSNQTYDNLHASKVHILNDDSAVMLIDFMPIYSEVCLRVVINKS